MKDWFPKKLGVGKNGTPSTYNFISSAYGDTNTHLQYAEIGIYETQTAKEVLDRYPNSTVYLFDYKSYIDKAKEKLKSYGDRVKYYSNTQKYLDSYNWSLIKIIEERKESSDKDIKIKPLFDYCFIDGSHTFAIDALTFYLCDKLLHKEGYIDFDDWCWTVSGSTVDPSKVPIMGDLYTDEQNKRMQVDMIISNLVRTDVRYKEVKNNKIFQKVRL